MKELIVTSLALLLFPLMAFAQQADDRDKGIELYRQGEFQKAADILLKRTQVEEKDRLAWLYLGASYVHLDKKDDAVKAFNKTDVVYSENLPEYDSELQITSKPKPRYTKEARSRNTSGTVRLAIEFKAGGTLGFVVPVRELPHGLTDQAVEAAKGIKFKPAVIDGKPVTVVKIMSYTFTIF
ncbi:MAG: energy transducer TonB [Pyrinomonadaceae bacterium]|nr:energy transducer TonB [Pyrinomonadaceae bacterium]